MALCGDGLPQRCTRIPCYPSFQRGAVHRNTALGHDFFQISIADTVSNMETHCQRDHCFWILRTYESNHGSTFNWVTPVAAQVLMPQRSMVKICYCVTVVPNIFILRRTNSFSDHYAHFMLTTTRIRRSHEFFNVGPESEKRKTSVFPGFGTKLTQVACNLFY